MQTQVAETAVKEQKLVAVIAQRDWAEVWVNYFLADEGVDAESALREATKEFLSTERGLDELDRNNGNFNWGDVVNTVPGAFLERHGIKVFYHGKPVTISSTTEIVVDNDELLEW